MEHQANSQLKQSLVYGGMLGLAAIVISVVAYMLGMAENRSIQWVHSLVQIVLIIIGVKNFRDQHSGGFISYGKALGTGFLIGLIGGLIGVTYFYVFITYIDTDFVVHMIEKAQEKMVEQGLSDEQIEKAIKYQQKFMAPIWILIWGLLGTVFMSFVFSAIIAIFLKKKDESFEGNFQ